MENYPYSSSYPDSDGSSPRSREIECETGAAAAAWDDAPQASPAARVKLMCSYGGRIQPRSHDNQLSYVGGDTKIIAVDRSIRYPSLIGKLNALPGSDDVILKYQLPGEDLDALISVTNDEDIEHMMIEYDRLHRSGSKHVQRLRLFLFAAPGKGGQDPACFAQPPPSVALVSPRDVPDYLFGLDAARFVPQAAEVKEPASDNERIEMPPAPARSPTEMQRLEIAEKQPLPQQVSSIQLNGSDDSLTMVYPPPVQENVPPAPAPAAYWPDHNRSVAAAARFASFVGVDGKLYLIPANAGVFQASGAPGQAFYTAAVQRVVQAPAYDSQASMYSPPPQQAKAPGAYDNVVMAQVGDASAGYAAPPAAAYDNSAGYAAYDSAGRPLYFAGLGATYQTVTNVAVKPSQVS